MLFPSTLLLKGGLGKGEVAAKEKTAGTQGGSPLFSHFFRGRVKVKRVVFSSLSARRAPWCSFAMAWAMGSPRPKPLCSPREASAR